MQLLKLSILNAVNIIINFDYGNYPEEVKELIYDILNEDEYVIVRKAYIKCGNKYKSVNYVSYQEGIWKNS